MFYAGMRNILSGYVCVAASQKGIVSITFPQKTAMAAMEKTQSVLSGMDVNFSSGFPLCVKCLDEIQDYFNSKLINFNIPLDLGRGSDFDREVWKAILKIPYGKTKSYGWAAEKTGRPKGARAVGGALGRNPVPIIVPCHRIIKSDGSIGGFGAGIKWKNLLLDLENSSGK
jgi:methylated-DNA-[protein]-cysteine S-methyltransferase